jgi:hypothetical protein
MISQEEKSKKVLLAEEKLAQAKAQLNRAKREQRAEIEKAMLHGRDALASVEEFFMVEFLLVCRYNNKRYD